MRQTTSESGYNLIALTVAVTVLNVLLATALPLWSTAIQRDKEEELIFRGLQYAEGFRLYQRRFAGKNPSRLQELIEIQPRCMRKLWRDPMMEDGEWGLIFAGQGQPINPNNPNAANPTNPFGNDSRGGGEEENNEEAPPVPTSDLGDESGRTVTVGPIEGVFSRSTERSHLVFMNQETYNAWQFRASLVTTPVGVPGQPGNAAPALNSRWIGRPLRTGIQLPQVNAPRPVGVGGDPTVLPGSGNLAPNPRRQLPNTFGGGQPQPPPQTPNQRPNRRRP